MASWFDRRAYVDGLAIWIPGRVARVPCYTARAERQWGAKLLRCPSPSAWPSALEARCPKFERGHPYSDQGKQSAWCEAAECWATPERGTRSGSIDQALSA